MASLRELPLTVMHTYYDPRVPAPLTPDYLDTTTATALEVILARSVAGFTEAYPDVHVTKRVALGLTQRQLRQGLNRWSLIVVGRHRRSSVVRLFHVTVSTSVLERFRGVVAMVPEGETPHAR